MIMSAVFKNALSNIFGGINEWPWDGMQPVWLASTAAIHEALETLPGLPRKEEAEWVSDELHNLSKKKDASSMWSWKHSCDANLKLVQEHQCLHKYKLTKLDRC